MHHEWIRSNPNWQGEFAQYDTVFIKTDLELEGMAGLAIGRALLLLSFMHGEKTYSCALVHWLVPGNKPDPDTGMWVVQLEYEGNGHRTLSIVNLNSIARAAHLLPVYGSSFVPNDLHFSDALDVFRAYFVNLYADHHTYEFLK
jgi:hypothetical protein